MSYSFVSNDDDSLTNCPLPRAKSSSISRSFGFADIDKYSAVTEYLFDCRIERLSFEVMVFCRDTGTKEDVEEVEARDILEAGCSIIATGLMCGKVLLSREDDGLLPQTQDIRLIMTSSLKKSSNGPQIWM